MEQPLNYGNVMVGGKIPSEFPDTFFLEGCGKIKHQFPTMYHLKN
jgi:hypothetical protein